MPNTSLTLFPAIQGRAIIKTATATITASSSISATMQAAWRDTGLTITYTPSNANSVLLIFGSVIIGQDVGANTGLRLDRDGTTLPVSDQSATPQAGLGVRFASVAIDTSTSFMQLHPTTSTSSTTIKLQARTNSASATAGTLNADYAAADTNANTVGRYVSTINIWEIL